jgi:hypothetical protein
LTAYPWLVCHVPLPEGGSPRWAVRRYLGGRFTPTAFPGPRVRLTRIAAQPLPHAELCAALWPVLCEVAERLELSPRELPRRVHLDQAAPAPNAAGAGEEGPVCVRIEIVGGAVPRARHPPFVSGG